MTTTTGRDPTVAPAATSRRPPARTLNARVLVAENHDDTRFMLRTMLEMRGASVVEAVNGEAAVELAMSMRLDLILIDTDLPLLDGYAVTRRIRELDPAREIPIIILSGHAQPSAEVSARAAGCTDYLIKPFPLGELGRLLERRLSQSRTH
jgi:CheY-like chemotaxis protein